MTLNAKTTICAIIGNPVEHSLSPLMHNAAYEKLGLNFAYTAFKVENIQDAISGIKALGIRGVSVTIPHKLSVMPLLDVIDETAKVIGAVNTIVNDDGKLTGFNTDCEGAMRALEEVAELTHKKVILIGAGGAARAIAFGLQQKNANVLIINRTIEKAQELAKKTSAQYGDLSKLPEIKNADIVIHATATGMTPNINESLIPKEYFKKGQVVFDIVYNPKETKLLQEAKEAGCKIVYGYNMLLYQAVGQFERFTQKDGPLAIMKDVLVTELSRRNI